jgi:hypothetical protein
MTEPIEMRPVETADGEVVFQQVTVPYEQSLTSVAHAFLISLVIIAIVLATGYYFFG